jgi:outer membrane protein assembly factor BamB
MPRHPVATLRRAESLPRARWHHAWLLVVGLLLLPAARADDWPQWQGPKRDGVWRETGILDKFPKGGPKVLWKTDIGGGFSGPAVVGNRVYVLDRQGPPLRPGQESPGKDGLAGKERVLCLDAATGKEVWKHEYDCLYTILYPSGPRTTPVVQDSKVWTLGAMGDLLCLDADKGKVIWSKNLPKEFNTKPPLWGYSAHLLVDGGKVVTLVGGENSAVAAFDKDTGKEAWRALTVKEVGYAPPLMIEAGGKKQLIVWHTEAVNALNPNSGKPYWSEKFPADEPQRPAITTATPRRVDDLLFVSSPHHGSLMLKLDAGKPAAKVLWKGKSDNVAEPDGLHALMNSPVLQDGHIYGVCSFGELRCLKANTGERLWESYEATTGKKALFGNAFLVPQGDRFFLFNDKGELVIARLTPKGCEVIDRAVLLEPTLTSRGRDVLWCHPAFANKCVFVRNDKEILCVSLAAEKKG